MLLVSSKQIPRNTHTWRIQHHKNARNSSITMDLTHNSEQNQYPQSQLSNFRHRPLLLAWTQRSSGRRIEIHRLHLTSKTPKLSPCNCRRPQSQTRESFLPSKKPQCQPLLITWRYPDHTYQCQRSNKEQPTRLHTDQLQWIHLNNPSNKLEPIRSPTSNKLNNLLRTRQNLP